MGTGYTRNDTSNNIANGNVIDADDLDGEFNALESAFNASTGHTHDGTSAEGAPIEVTGPNQEYLSDATALYPKTDDTYDLGKTGAEWKDLYVDGVANIDTLNLSGTVVTATGAELNTLDGITATTAELNTLDGITATTVELNYNDIASLGTSQASKVVTADANGNVKLQEEVQATCYLETAVSVPSTTIDCDEGNLFYKTISANTTFSFSYSGVNLTSNDAYAFTLILTVSGTRTVSWPASVDWAGGSAPDAPASGETDVFVFVTRNGGSTWYGFQAGDALA